MEHESSCLTELPFNLLAVRFRHSDTKTTIKRFNTVRRPFVDLRDTFRFSGQNVLHFIAFSQWIVLVDFHAQ